MNLVSLKGTLVSEFVMACIEVGSQDDAFRIFETLNDRGLPLAAPDLLLNYLMWKSEPKTDRDDIREQWDHMVDTLKRQNIERFLRAFWVSQYGDLKEGKLFPAIKHKIVESGWSSLKFVSLCNEECQDFYYIVTQDKDELGERGAVLTKRILRELTAHSALPYLLSCFRCLSKDRFAQAASLALVFITRYSVIMHLDPSGMESLLFRLAAEVREKMRGATKATRSSKEGACIQFLKSEFIATSPSEESIRGKIPELLLDPNEASYFVWRIASRMQSQTKELAFDKVNLEHIFPKNPDRNEWSKSAIEELSPVLWHLGNLTVIGKNKNATACKNLSYEHKRPHYETSEVKMNQKIAETYKHWGKEVVTQRAVHLTKRILEIWDFENTDLA